MEKYKTEFKPKVVKSFLAGEGGAKLLALGSGDYNDYQNQHRSFWTSPTFVNMDQSLP